MVLSVHPGKKRMIALGAALVVLTVALLCMPHRQAQSETGISRAGATADQRLAFLAQFGWEVEAEPLEIREIVIPEKFDEVYTRYNALQKEQGMDLLPYAGKTCKQWIYKVLNYPISGEEVRAVMLVYEGQVIGGDISSVALDGFMVTFQGPDGEEQGATESTEEEKEAVAVTDAAIPEDAWPVD